MATDVPLTPEHEEMVRQLLERLKEYQIEYYHPPAGWGIETMSSGIRTSLSKADGASPVGHKHVAADITDLGDNIDAKMSDYAPKSHRHGKSDLDNLSTTSAPNTIVLRDGDGLFAVESPTSATHPATKGYVDNQLKLKAGTSHKHALEDVTGLPSALDSKSGTGHTHDIDDIPNLRHELQQAAAGGDVDLTNKADLVNGLVPLSQIPQLASTKIEGLVDKLASKADLDKGKLKKEQLPSLQTSQVDGLDTFIASQANNAKLVAGQIPEGVLPDSVFDKIVKVASLAEMYGLTSVDVQPGDLATIASGPDIGSYMLNSKDPSKESSWVKLNSAGGVMSVNDKTGDVTLTAADVGARKSGDIPIADVKDLRATLDGKAESSQLSNYATTASVASLQNKLQEIYYTLRPVDYVSTSRIASLSGQQNVDGQVVPVGSKVLLTNQSSSVQNGSWVVSSANWYRDNYLPDGATVPKGALISVKSGKSEANTLWQFTGSTSTTVGSGALGWEKVLGGGSSATVTVGNGLQSIDGVISAKGGQNISVTAAGIALDPTGLMRKYAADVPSGSNVATITHGLNTRDVYVSVVEVSTGDIVLAGVTVNNANAVSVEFASAPTAGQYRAVVFG